MQDSFLAVWSKRCLTVVFHCHKTSYLPFSATVWVLSNLLDEHLLIGSENKTQVSNFFLFFFQNSAPILLLRDLSSEKSEQPRFRRKSSDLEDHEKTAAKLEIKKKVG